MTDLGRLVANNKLKEFRKRIKKNKIEIVEGRNFFIELNKPKINGLTDRLIIPQDSLSLLHVAAFFDNLEMFILIESLGISLRVLSGSSYFPLHYACLGRAIECAAYILEQDPEQATMEFDCQWQPVFLATFANSPTILEMLFSHGANLQSRKNVENRPFEQALKSGHMECLKILLTHKCKTDVAFASISPLMFAVSRYMGAALEPLLDLGLDPSFVTYKGETVLSTACANNDLDSVRLLCNRMNTIEIPAGDEERHSSIVRYAVSSKNLEILKIVLEKGCDVNRYDSLDNIPADAIRGTVPDDVGVKMLELLIQYGFDVNCRCEKTGKSFIDRVVEYSIGRYPKVVEFLLDNGADVHYVLPSGETLINKVKTFKTKCSQYRMPIQKKYYEIFSRHFPEEFADEQMPHHQ